METWTIMVSGLNPRPARRLRRIAWHAANALDAIARRIRRWAWSAHEAR